ncbi:MAG TPA: hypothetical protein VMI72_11690 [Roseiarcus sp.]|nr:hypothetical protein [Roseiarcus sp.]
MRNFVATRGEEENERPDNSQDNKPGGHRRYGPSKPPLLLAAPKLIKPVPENCCHKPKLCEPTGLAEVSAIRPDIGSEWFVAVKDRFPV